LGRACLVLANKWDLVGEEKRDKLEESWLRLDETLSEPTRVNISALTGRGIQKVFPAVGEILERCHLQVGTADLNRLFEEIIHRHRPPAVEGKEWRILYSTQVKTAPPTFMIFANRKMPRQSDYRRYLENSLRRELDLQGVPIRLVVRHR